MAVTIYNDLVDGTSAREEGGRVVELSTAAILQSDDPATDWGSDATACRRVLDYLTDNGTAFDPGSTLHATYGPNLYLDGREVVFLGEGGTARVRAHFTYYNSGLTDPYMVPKVTPRLTVTTRDTDRDGLPAPTQVTHDGITQQAEYTAMIPEYAVEYEVVEQTGTPDLAIGQWFGKVNDDPFHGWPPEHVLCTGINYRPLVLDQQGREPPLADQYIFTLQFTYRMVSWQPEVQWIDVTTARSPSDLATDTGRKKVLHYQSRSFSVGSLLPDPTPPA